MDALTHEYGEASRREGNKEARLIIGLLSLISSVAVEEDLRHHTDCRCKNDSRDRWENGSSFMQQVVVVAVGGDHTKHQLSRQRRGEDGFPLLTQLVISFFHHHHHHHIRQQQSKPLFLTRLFFSFSSGEMKGRSLRVTEQLELRKSLFSPDFPVPATRERDWVGMFLAKHIRQICAEENAKVP